MVVPMPFSSMIVPALFEERSMMRAIWIICLVAGFSVVRTTPMDPVAMPVLDVNSLDAVAPDGASAERDAKQSTAEQAAVKPATAEPSTAKPAVTEVVDAASAQPPASGDAPKADDLKEDDLKANDPKSDAPKSDAAKPDAVAEAKSNKGEKSAQAESNAEDKSAPVRTRRRLRHIRAAAADPAGQKKPRQRARMQAEAKMRDDEALRNANAAEQPADPACTDGNTLLRAFNLSPPCR
jgi:hypothetical protein